MYLTLAYLSAALGGLQAQGIKAPQRPPIAVAEKDGITAAGVSMNACNNCGNCCSGCTFSAKKSLDKNYIAAAAANGAQIFTQVLPTGL